MRKIEALNAVLRAMTLRNEVLTVVSIRSSAPDNPRKTEGAKAARPSRFATKPRWPSLSQRGTPDDKSRKARVALSLLAPDSRGILQGPGKTQSGKDLSNNTGGSAERANVRARSA